MTDALGPAADVAVCADRLCSDASSLGAGTALTIDGGVWAGIGAFDRGHLSPAGQTAITRTLIDRLRPREREGTQR